MDTATVIAIIVVAVVIILIVAGLTWMLLRKRKEDRRVEAAGIREHAAKQSFKIGQREALADQTAAKARGAQADADAKAAEAARLEQQAEARHSAAASSREELNQEFERADKIDPESESRDTSQGNEPDQQHRHP